ncbi:cation-transporting P-type ATPase [Pseudomonadota bacterium]
MSTTLDTDSYKSALATVSSSDDTLDRSLRSIYGRDVGAVAQGLNVDIDQGLTLAEVESRLEIYGPNKLAKAEKDSLVVMFLRQFVNPLLIILLVGALISAYTGHWVDAIASLPTLGLSALKEIFNFKFL